MATTKQIGYEMGYALCIKSVHSRNLRLKRYI